MEFLSPVHSILDIYYKNVNIRDEFHFSEVHERKNSMDSRDFPRPDSGLNICPFPIKK